MAVVVVSAARFEAEPFLQGEVSQKLKVDYLSCGIGALNAAKAEAKIVECCRGKDVIFIGSCGSFYPFQGVHLVQVDKTYWLPPCERAGLSASIEDLSPPIYLPAPPPWLDLPVKTAICSPTITLENVFRDTLTPVFADRSRLVENLELYSCAQGLARAAKSLAVIFGVTNELGPEGRRQWRNNHLEAAEMTAQYLCERLL